MLLNMVAEEADVAAEETMATVLGKREGDHRRCFGGKGFQFSKHNWSKTV
jgi:hypothetical protein